LLEILWKWICFNYNQYRSRTFKCSKFCN